MDLDSPVAPAPGGRRVRRGRRRAALVAVAAVAAVALLVWLGRQGGAQVPRFAAWVEGLGVWGPLAFVAGYAVAAVALVPGSLLTLAAGAIFGLARGTAYVFVGATLGASAAFLVARYLARGAVERRLAGHPRFAALDRAVGREGRKIVFLLRLSPVFPFNLLNYGLGLTRVRFVDYLVACLGMLPGTFLYVYYGKLLGSVAEVAGGADVERGAEYWLFLALGIAATVAATAVITRRARQALATAAPELGRASTAAAGEGGDAGPPATNGAAVSAGGEGGAGPRSAGVAAAGEPSAARAEADR